jgi:BirA family transcriptional regulator, biotin operon repressor / biotin---[acetyl-CoA-carboxylase] ligase
MIDLARLRTAFPERRIEFFPELDSTMHAAAGMPRGSVVLANRQTAGVGRHGHAWHSEPSNGIYCSVVFAPAPVLTLALGVATVEAIAQTYGIVCDLRWPNDLMLDGKKVAGILVQLAGADAIAGIGINVNHTLFPPELEDEATSLCIHEGRRLSRERILLKLIPALEAMAAEDKDTVLALFTRASSYVAGRRVEVHQPGGLIVGTTAGLNPDGYLIVRRDDGTDTLILAGGVRAASA